MADDRTPLLAVLIDADNVPAKFAEDIFKEVATLGEASVRRVYGDAAKAMNGWDSVQLKLGLVAHHQPPYTKGKNASDIALVIDGMDLLHSGRFDGFVLVSSDSDFTRLAQRIREQGIDVYGMGEKKSAEAFRMACKRFIYVENLGGAPEAAAAAEDNEAPDPAELIGAALAAVEDDEGWAGLGGIGSQLSKSHPDFDPRSYGYRRLSDLVEATGAFTLQKTGNNLHIRAKEQAKPRRRT